MLKVDITDIIMSNFERKPEYDYIFKSMVIGNTPNELYVDKQSDPNIMILWDTKITFYVLENNSLAKDQEKAIQFLRNMILEKNFKFAKLYATSDEINKLLFETFKDHKLEKYNRILYKHSGNLEGIKIQNSNNISLKVSKITQDLLKNNKLENIELLIDEINGMWQTKENFLEKGFGYCCFDDKKIIGWCTAEYMSDNSCGCGVETIKEYQRKGYASLMAKKVSEEAIALGKDLYWDSWDWNVGSVKTAEKVNFSKVTNYQVVFLKL